MKKYSVWLIPKGKIYITLAKIISDLSNKHSSPLFKPHITLIGDIDTNETSARFTTAHLSTLIDPFKLRLRKMNYLNEKFRCLFLKVEKSSELIKAIKLAKSVFDIEDSQEPMPHLSLMYGYFDSNTKEKIISEYEREFDEEFEVDSIHLVRASSDIDPADWQIIQEFYLPK